MAVVAVGAAATVVGVYDYQLYDSAVSGISQNKPKKQKEELQSQQYVAAQRYLFDWQVLAVMTVVVVVAVQQ